MSRAALSSELGEQVGRRGPVFSTTSTSTGWKQNVPGGSDRAPLVRQHVNSDNAFGFNPIKHSFGVSFAVRHCSPMQLPLLRVGSQRKHDSKGQKAAAQILSILPFCNFKYSVNVCSRGACYYMCKDRLRSSQQNHYATEGGYNLRYGTRQGLFRMLDNNGAIRSLSSNHFGESFILRVYLPDQLRHPSKRRHSHSVVC